MSVLTKLKLNNKSVKMKILNRITLIKGLAGLLKIASCFRFSFKSQNEGNSGVFNPVNILIRIIRFKNF